MMDEITKPDHVELRGHGRFELEIKGESHYQASIAEIVHKHGKVNLDAVLILEDENPYDHNAVRVEMDGKIIGYLSREVAPIYREQLRLAGWPQAKGMCRAKIFGGTSDRPSFGVWLDILVEK